MTVSSVTNINCAYPTAQNSLPKSDCVITNPQAFKGDNENGDKFVQNGLGKISKNSLTIGGLIAAAGVAALVVFRKNIFKDLTPLEQLIKDAEKKAEFTKKDFVKYIEDNCSKIEGFKKSFVMKLDKNFQDGHNLKDTNNLLLLGYYVKGKATPILAKIIDCEKIGKDLKSFLNKADIGIFKGKDKKVV